MTQCGMNRTQHLVIFESRFGVQHLLSLQPRRSQTLCSLGSYFRCCLDQLFWEVFEDAKPSKVMNASCHPSHAAPRFVRVSLHEHCVLNCVLPTSAPKRISIQFPSREAKICSKEVISDLQRQLKTRKSMIASLTLHTGRIHRFDCTIIITRVSMACMLDCQGSALWKMYDVGGVGTLSLSSIWQTIRDRREKGLDEDFAGRPNGACLG